ncbi:MAG: hypothetical protein LBO69_04235 [Ignavibacteria bacterium]|nr:hypothetical protein [Ignavibacteria bacterium]
MKNFAVILLLFVFGFSVTAPLWEQQVAAYQVCQNDSNCDDGCCSEFCSPFHACSHCHGFLFTEGPDGIALLHSKFNPIPYSQHHISHFCGDIWQPPKIS